MPANLDYATDTIYEAVEAAQLANMSVEDLLDELRDAWLEALKQQVKADSDEWDRLTGEFTRRQQRL